MKFQIISKSKLKILSAALVVFVFASCKQKETGKPKPITEDKTANALFAPPDTITIPHDQFGDMIRYGRDLILYTAKYLGPDGTVGHYLGNKMNCTNCHLDAGTRPYGFNFFSSHARYPQYRGRENKVLTLAQRVNNCIERPHNGKPIPLDGKEMVAMVSYIKWLGTNVPVGQHANGDESMELAYPARAADTVEGAKIYAAQCSVCHGKEGEGKWAPDQTTYLFPPLWGPFSYQDGSSPSRVLKLARFIKANMPDKKATWRQPALTDGQCIDVAAYINNGKIHPRPQKKDKTIPDYPLATTKAIDYDKGPYPDTFSAAQHKYGPYQPIIDYHKAHNLPVIF